MNLRDSRGATLIEVVVAVGIAAVFVGATLAAVLPAVRALAPDAADVALQQLVDREMRAARDVLKYDGSALAPATIATSVPLPGASPLPITLTLQSESDGEGATLVTITASDASGEHAARADATIAARAPQPGRTFAPNAAVPMPTGAP